MTRSGDKVRDQVITRMFQAMLPYIDGWIETLGRAGQPPDPKDKWSALNLKDRVGAAKTGIDFVTKFAGEGAGGAGATLLKELESIGRIADGAEPDPTEGSDWAEDPGVPAEARDLV